ncbi:uncharacterized protein [Miscanthus floridulus]|uniref:uncharacterized protein isoform X1 n=1 Tax=Miscanthus floridulus TaxID=154761 RepID=UPI00345A9B05
MMRSSRDWIRGCLKQSICQPSEFCKRGQPIREEVIWELTQFFNAFQLFKLPLRFTVQVCTCERGGCSWVRKVCYILQITLPRCVAAKGEAGPECEKFPKYYRSLCPSEWVIERGLLTTILLDVPDIHISMFSTFFWVPHSLAAFWLVFQK